MRIGVLGINHKAADLAFRERLAKACACRFGAENLFIEIPYVLLSTCNRTELYFTADDLAATHTYLLSVLRHDLDEEFEHKLYAYFGVDCFLHLARVTAGMDSALVGETEIQGQVKNAYEKTAALRPLSSELHYIFQKALKIGKEVRSHITLAPGMPTLEEAILKAGRSLFDSLEEKKVLFVGVSEINQKIFTRFKQKGLTDITFCNRSRDKVEKMAARDPIAILPWHQLDGWFHYDLIIFGTKSPDHLVHEVPKGVASKLIIDLSVPRNVNPQVGSSLITLLNVDQLNTSIDRRRRQKSAQLARIETHLIAHSVHKLTKIYREKEKRRLLAV